MKTTEYGQLATFESQHRFFDFAFSSYEDKSNKDIIDSGAHIKVFEGEYQGTAKNPTPYKKLSPTWADLSLYQPPARLEKNGMVFYGVASRYIEVGSGVYDVFYSNNIHDGELGRIFLDDDDIVTIFDTVEDGTIEWEGEIIFGDNLNNAVSHLQDFRRSTQIDAINMNNWYLMSERKRPVAYTPAG